MQTNIRYGSITASQTGNPYLTKKIQSFLKSITTALESARNRGKQSSCSECVPMNVLDQIITMDVAKTGISSVQQRFLFLEDLSGVDAKKPSAVFPLRTVMVVVFILGISALLSCCYHWEKIKTLYSRHTISYFGDTSFIPTGSPNVSDAHCGSASSSCKNLGTQTGGGTVAVMMPGDETPNFVALPSPHGVISSTSVFH